MTSAQQLHLTVASESGLLPAPDLGLADDLRLLKAALLYADQVKLCSVGTSIAVDIVARDDLHEDHKLDIVEWRLRTDWRPLMQRQFTLDRLNRYRSWRAEQRQKPTFWPPPDLFWLGRHWKQEWSDLEGSVRAAAQAAGADGLAEALNYNLLEVHPFPVRSLPDRLVDQTNEEFFDLLRRAVGSGGTSPLLNAEAGKLVNWCIRRGTMVASEPYITRGRHGALAFEFLRRLPLFEGASVREVLDVRRELSGPLVRFRSAVIEFSDEIQSASWDKDFPVEAERVFLREVEPAVLEIRESVEENVSLRELTAKAVRPKELAAGLGIMLTSLDHLPDLAAVVLGSSVTTTGTLRSVYREMREEWRKAEGSRMFFYYSAGERLARQRPSSRAV